MSTFTAAIVFGVLPSNNQLPGQVLACLDRARTLLRRNMVQTIAVIGGFGHGSRGQVRPEAHLMRDYLLEKGVNEDCILTRDKPVTTPEAVYDILQLKIQNGCILTIRTKRDRIGFLVGKIIGQRVNLTVHSVLYAMTNEEREANQYEAYHYSEARNQLGDMPAGDDAVFAERYSFEYHLWMSFVLQLEAEGQLETICNNCAH